MTRTMRERRITRTEATGLHDLDTVLLAGLAGAMVGLTIWIDL